MTAFPDLRPLGLEDRALIQDYLWKYQPETSELTFTNLHIWQSVYRWRWTVSGDWLLLLQEKEGEEPVWLPPVGPSPRGDIARAALHWLQAERGVRKPAFERADSRFALEVGPAGEFEVIPERNHFDYVYQTSELIALKGGRYHAKRNHISRFLQDHGTGFEFVPISVSNLQLCAEFQERWCEWRRCDEDMNLHDEWTAVRRGLSDYQALGLRGAAILIAGKVEAFTFGELLNAQTAVVHIEKANPEIPGLYAVINRQFCETYWSAIPFINREQDLAEDGLRKAKLSYHPNRLVEKYRVELAGPPAL
jgi:uncharacterized protein